jgi:8-oxo-dGTP pyrophosphatase MutT (NUDIX family)
VTAVAQWADDTERAFGAVAWRLVDGEVRVAVVHRPRYGDWSLPKGKPEPDELPEATARREVAEETGARGTLGAFLGTSVYPVPGPGRKVVGYWALAVDAWEPRPADAEVDAVDWWTLAEARLRLSYDQDRTILDRFAEAVAVR